MFRIVKTEMSLLHPLQSLAGLLKAFRVGSVLMTDIFTSCSERGIWNFPEFIGIADRE